LAHAVARVLPEKLDACANAELAHCLFYLLDTSKFRESGATGFGDRHASRDPFVSDRVDISTDLLVKLALELPLSEDILKDAPDTRYKSHPVSPQVAFKAFAMAKATFAHCSVSALIWSSPAFVSR
jgi:hypothetical protein